METDLARVTPQETADDETDPKTALEITREVMAD